MSQLVVEKVTRSFGERRAVDGVSVAVAPGQCLALLGPSGSGKSTLLSLIAGFEKPDSGDIQIRDKSILKLSPHQRNVGVVFQQYALFPHLTVAENIAYPLQRRRIAVNEQRQRVRSLLTSVQLEEQATQSVQTLSGGQQQRVAIARALAASPDVLLMDEPMGALDRTLRDELQIELKSLLRQAGITVVYVTHDQREAIALAEEIAVLHNGRIQQVGYTERIFAAPQTSFVASFLWPGANRISVPIDSANGTHVSVRIAGNIMHARWSDAYSLQNETREIELIVRPRDVELRSPESASSSGIRASIEESIFAGDHRITRIRLATGEKLTAQQPLDSLWRSGDHVIADWKPERAFAYFTQPESRA